MSNQLGIPKAALVSINDMLDNCAKIQPGQEVLILAHIDGLYGSQNVIDEQAVSWVQACTQAKGANASILWIDEPAKLHAWRIPPVVKAAMAGADLMINFSADLVTEEIAEFRRYIDEVNTWMVRMFPATAQLLMTEWAQTPHELVSMIRHVSSDPFLTHMAKFVMTDPNGTHLEGYTLDPVQRPGIPGMPYNSWRRDASHYIPFPEWVHPPINCKDVNGVFVFDCMLSWWPRYIGIDPVWKDPIRIEVKDSRMVKISGGREADALERFLKMMAEKAGDGMYNFDTFHFGIHPNARVRDDQCPNAMHRRVIDHSHSSDLHVHIGSCPSSERYAYYPHITGDIRNATLTVNDALVYDKGHLCCLEDPRVLAVAAKYPGRPGVPKRF